MLLLSVVVLVAVDALGFLILLLTDGLAILSGEVAVILGAHALDFLVDSSFLMLEVRGFTGGELTALDALSDTVLLVLFALCDGGGLG